MCDIVPVGACVAGDSRSYTMRIRAATGIYSAYVVLYGLLATNRRCVLADALLIKLRRCASPFSIILALPKRQSQHTTFRWKY